MQKLLSWIGLYREPKPQPQKPKHPLIVEILDLVCSEADPWIQSHGEVGKFVYLNRTVSDRLWLRDTGTLTVSHKTEDGWKHDSVSLSSDEKRILRKAYDEIMRNRARKIVAYRSPKPQSDECI